MKKQYLAFMLIFSICSSINAQVSVAKIFANNMVLQRNSPIPVWGWAAANEKIEVRFNNQIKKAKADKNGKWTIRLDNETAGGPYALTIKGKNTIEIKNVLVGDVWLCSGQSNMERTVGHSTNSAKEIASADYPFIRYVKILHATSTSPLSDVSTDEWKVCDSTTVSNFSGTAYFFARNIYNKLKIPIGLVNNSWGGVDIESWISREGFENSEEFAGMIAGMPKINLDSLSKAKSQDSKSIIEGLQGTKLEELNASLFKDISFDDSKWLPLNEPQLWDKESVGKLCYVVWLRKTIFLSTNDIKNKATFELEATNNEDRTYINGNKVGNTYVADTPRKYYIPAGLLKEGKNVIVVRVVDYKSGGGIYDDVKKIKLSVGKTSISLDGNWKFQVESVKKPVNGNLLPTICYNALINPLTNFAFKGVLYCQGENNTGRAYQYRKTFPLLINDWRKKFGKPNMPFYYVQLSSLKTGGNSNEGCSWAELREAQTMTLSLPNTRMVVTTDIGNPSDIHPTNKQDVGKRLAAIALKNVYNKNIVCSGPSFKAMEIQGNQIIATFENTGSGLSTSDKYGYVKGFEIAGNNQIFYYAKAQIVNNKVVIYNENVPNPISIHFGWADDASDDNLYNKEEFPAVPFRTNEWKSIMKESKYKIAK
ncbi:sialate O-acetylesterase [Lutibacter sp.]|uniref:sialate O-acetylesterase n=1 Tax=Lutibacter sp. TaxID=1925666 RepID=UPI0027342FDF|nr:sialate O-acetylesterase [Lutibacter sp.]MDP3311725.1 sialate O-acetylesterase [Lutibacter sp.]